MLQQTKLVVLLYFRTSSTMVGDFTYRCIGNRSIGSEARSSVQNLRRPEMLMAGLRFGWPSRNWTWSRLLVKSIASIPSNGLKSDTGYPMVYYSSPVSVYMAHVLFFQHPKALSGVVSVKSCASNDFCTTHDSSSRN
jgi:hypothetical protein